MERGQQYQQARRIGRISLSDLIAKNIIEGESIPGAIGASISQKFKGRVTRFKEKFDPLNIASMLVGRSRLGTAILGRLMGRSAEDITYFAKKGSRAGGARDPFYTRISTGSKEPVKRNDTTADVFAKLYNLMERMDEQEKRLREIQGNFKEEQDLEEEKRHEELLEAVTGQKRPTATKVKEEKDGDGLFGFIKKMFAGLMSFLAPFIKIGTVILSVLGTAFLTIISSLCSFLASPLGLGLLGLAGGIALSAYIAEQIGIWEKNKLREKGGEKAVEAQKELMAAPAATPSQESYDEFGGTAVSTEGQIAAEKVNAAVKEKQAIVARKMAEKGYPIKNTGFFGGITFEKKNGDVAPKELVKQISDEADKEIKEKDKQKTATPISKASLAPEKSMGETSGAATSSPITSGGETSGTATSSPITPGRETSGAATSSPITPTSVLGTMNLATPEPNTPDVPSIENIMKQNFELNLQESDNVMRGEPLIINKNNTGAVNLGGGDEGTVTGAAPVRDDALGDLIQRLQKRASIM